jgi:arylsulfatase A-like enzyme
MKTYPNVVFVFSDQHRAQATGYNGDPNVKTPVMDRLAQESINFTAAVSCMPVCSPYRGSLLTGQYPLTHGVFVNDVNLNHKAVSLADSYSQAGYDTSYIGKWHLDGHGRKRFIPQDRHMGFDTWKVLECTHDYNHSIYYAGNEPTNLMWDGYDAQAQTAAAQDYIRHHAGGKPFLLMLSWGPPHNPYETAPQRFQDMYDPAKIILRPNVPIEKQAQARQELSGYYAHISALDECLGDLLLTLEEQGIAEDTLFVYTSDHGDMLWSQGEHRKQRPWDESILVPFLLRWPRQFGNQGRVIHIPFNTPDIMPTLLGLCGLPIPSTVEGRSYAAHLRGDEDLQVEAALIECIYCFGEWTNPPWPLAREYRGLRGPRYTYVRDLKGPWLLYDNLVDPYQMTNLCGDNRLIEVQTRLDTLLNRLLADQGDDFLPGIEHMLRCGYPMDETGDVVYED